MPVRQLVRASGRTLSRKIISRAVSAGAKASFVRSLARRATYRRKAKRTASGPRTKSLNVRVQGVGGQISSFSRSQQASRNVLQVMKTSARNTHFWNDSTRLTADFGLASIQTYFNFSAGTYTTTPSSTNDLASLAYRIFGDITTGTNHNRASRFVVGSTSSTFKMTNQDNSNCEVIILDILTRRDTSMGPNDAYVDGINEQTSGAFTGAGLPPGIMPWDSQLFKTYFRVAQKTRIILGAGQSHTHKVSLRPNRMFYTGLLKENNKCLKGFTHATMVIVSGMPYNDSSTKTNVSTGNCALDIVFSKQLTYTWNDDTSATSNITNNILGKIATESVMETDGDVATGTQA